MNKLITFLVVLFCVFILDFSFTQKIQLDIVKLFGFDLKQIRLFLSLTICILLFFKVIFYRVKKSKKIPKKISIQQLRQMNWSKYEELMQAIFERKGYGVERKGGNGSDGGIDLILKKNGSTSMVQCKRYKGNVGVKIVREMFGVGVHHGFKKIFICTTSDFTREAKKFAKGKNIILINGEETIREINK